MLTHLHQQKQLMLLEAEAATMPYKTWIQENAREEKKKKKTNPHKVYSHKNKEIEGNCCACDTAMEYGK